MDTPLDFSAFVMNRLKVDSLTPELLAGPTFELMKGTCKSLVELEYFFEEVYKATTEQLDWTNPEVIPFDHFINNDLAYLSGGVSSRKYATSVTQTKATNYGNIKKIEDLVTNSIWREVPVSYDKYALWNKDKKNRLMRLDELHKFSDGTLDDVRTALDDRLKGIRMEYLPKTIWRQSDRERATTMIQAIDKRLGSRRIMRSLEKFVGGRPYEDSILQAENPVKEILLKLNLLDHRTLKDGSEGTGACGLVHALGGGESDQDLNDMEDDISA
ncbi:hypothetical protein Tco_0625703 [Tanacetum coccineum]|uniref:Protein TIC 214 n=1 Tax=Tanacetum coccineum TaxID=301880 RepID=A0ABQ4WHK6_9ASTR